METLEGMIERITFHNEENAYTVAKLKPFGKGNVVTVTGNFAVLHNGERVRLTGEWFFHNEYGKQFKVNNYETLSPVTLEGIEKFLASGLIKGVGTVTAKRIVEKFGLDTLEIMEHEPSRLTEVDKIGPKKAEAIAKGYAEQREIREVMLSMQRFGIGPNMAMKIYHQYGTDAADILKSNPYRLADDVFGIGFRTADRIASQSGVEKNDPARIYAGVRFVLGESANDGHTYLPMSVLMEKCQAFLEVEGNLITEVLTRLKEEKQIFLEDIQDDKAVFLAPFFFAERGTAYKLSSLLKFQKQFLETDDIEKDIILLEEKTGFQFAEKQKDALMQALLNGALVVTGGPGTGKTTTLRGIISLLEERDLKISLGAPTGRAAKRLSEATGREAKTIHRLLEVGYKEGGGTRFNRDETNPLETEVLIIDETSMVDIILMYNLLKAVKPGTRLILVGDIDQLPAVGPGNVLRDIIGSRVIPVVELNEVFRQSGESQIVLNAHRINKGEFPKVSEKEGDFFFIQEEQPEKVLQTIKDLCSRRLPKFLGCDPTRDIQVLTPMRKTLTGVENLNQELQGILNPENPAKAEVRGSGWLYRIGDKVMQIRNNYEKMVFNGDIGFISDINGEDQEVIVSYPEGFTERKIVYDKHQLDEIVLAYAVSVHKSQGSEYPVVVMPIMTQHYLLLQRNLLYTAITRAKKLMVLVGTKKAVAMAIGNNKIEERFTRLTQRLMQIRDENVELSNILEI